MPGVQIFSDKKFFIVQRVPIRGSLISDVERHGGRVVKFEGQADYVVADHLRKDAPPGSISYKFIEAAIKKGEIPNEEEHRIGHGTVTSTAASRPVGSLSQPTKGTRTPFTDADDAQLVQWVTDREREGHPCRGNEIYKQLADINPRHTYQSWRDRWIKFFSHKHIPSTASASIPRALPTPPHDQPAPAPASRGSGRTNRRPSTSPEPVPDIDASMQDTSGRPRMPTGFDDNDLKMILEEASHIEEVPHRSWDDCWKAWAKAYPHHSAFEWESFYKSYASKVYYERRATVSNAADADADAEDEVSIAQMDGAAASRISSSARQGPPKTNVRPETSNSQAAKFQSRVAPLEDKKRPAPGSSPPPEPKRQHMSSTLEKLSRIRASEAPVSHPLSVAEPPSSVAHRESGTSRTIPWEQPKKVSSETMATAQTVDPVARQASSQLLQTPLDASLGSLGRNSLRLDPTVLNTRLTAPSASEDRPTSSHAREEKAPSSPRRNKPLSQGNAALTKQNLAQVQAEHRRATQSRAKDISEDGSEKDQTEFAEFLQSMLPPSLVPESVPATVIKPRVAAQEEIPESVVGKSLHNDSDSEIESEELGSSPLISRQVNERLPKNSPPVAVARHIKPKPFGDLTPGAVQQRTTEQSRRVGSRNAFAQPTAVFRLPKTLMSSSPPIAAQQSAQEEVDITPIELDLPEPDGGFYNYMSSQSSDNVLPSIEDVLHAPIQRPSREKQTDTQAIFDMDTQNIDFELPGFDHDLSWDSSPVPSPETRRRSTYLLDNQRPASPIPSEGDDMDAYIDAKVKAGAKEEHVMIALQATSMETKLAEIVIELLGRGKDIPRTLAGIWTKEDDVAVESSDPVRLKAVERKHGAREMGRRLELLSSWRE